MQNGKLFVVPTPVGNLQDMTFRAIEVLKAVSLVLCEDTRTSGFLFKHYGISTPKQSFHMHNEHKAVENVIARIKSGSEIALISDAGTPGISDPGFLLIRECVANDIPVETLPGATAFVPALVNSGFPCDRFCFEGFIPQKKGRQKKLTSLESETRTVIFYESPHRIVKTLDQFVDHFGPDRLVSVSREISKLHEETVRGTVKEVWEHFTTHPPKGEFVVILKGTE